MANHIFKTPGIFKSGASASHGAVGTYTGYVDLYDDDTIKYHIDGIGGGTIYPNESVVIDTNEITGTPAERQAAIMAVFPKANSGTGGTGTTDASQLTSGTLDDARLSANVTKQGNTFNGISQLVKTDASGKLPAIDGSQLTGISAGGTLYSATGSNTDGAMTQAATTTELAKKSDAAPADYTIQKIGSTYYASPAPNSGLTAYSNTDAYTVIQGAINTLNGLGSIKININGAINLSDELVITGQGGVYMPHRSLVITGNGFSTRLIQNTAGKNGIVIKNRAGIKLSNLYIEVASGGKSALLLDNSGAASEVSVYQSNFDYLYLMNNSATYPAFYAKNFWYSTFPHINAINNLGDAMVLENNSTNDTHYGNSSFGQIYVVSSASAGFAGLRIQTGVGASAGYLDHCTIANFEHGAGGDYGIYSTTALDFSFGIINLENFDHAIYLGAGGTKTQGFTFTGGFIIANTGATTITCGTQSGSNVFNNIKIVGDGTTIPISDQLAANANAPNSYDLWLGTTVDPTKISIAWPSQTPLVTRSPDYGIQKTVGGSPTISTINGSTASGGNLTLSSTSHATKGKVNLGTASAYDQANDRLGIGTTAPPYAISVNKSVGNTQATLLALRNLSGSAWGAGIKFYDDSPGNNLQGSAWVGTKYSAVNYATGRLAFDVSVDGGVTAPVEAMGIIGATRNVLINTTTDVASSKLTINSTTQGVLLPRMTKAQRDAIASPVQGLIVFVTDGTGYLSWYNAGWQKVSSTAD